MSTLAESTTWTIDSIHPIFCLLLYILNPVLIFKLWIAAQGPCLLFFFSPSFLRYTMDSGKLPNYKSSYLFRFHPYARVKPSARERVMAVLYTSDDNGFFSKDQRFIPSYRTAVSGPNPSTVIAPNLDDVVNLTGSVDASRRKLSMSTLVVDLALLMCRKPSPTD